MINWGLWVQCATISPSATPISCAIPAGGGESPSCWTGRANRWLGLYLVCVQRELEEKWMKASQSQGKLLCSGVYKEGGSLGIRGTLHCHQNSARSSLYPTPPGTGMWTVYMQLLRKQL